MSYAPPPASYYDSLPPTYRGGGGGGGGGGPSLSSATYGQSPQSHPVPLPYQQPSAYGAYGAAATSSGAGATYNSRQPRQPQQPMYGSSAGYRAGPEPQQSWSSPPHSYGNRYGGSATGPPGGSSGWTSAYGSQRRASAQPPPGENGNEAGESSGADSGHAASQPSSSSGCAAAYEPARRSTYPPQSTTSRLPAAAYAASAGGGADPYGPSAYASQPMPGGGGGGAGAPIQTDDFGAIPPGKAKTQGGFKAKTGDAWKSFQAKAKNDLWKVAVVKATNHEITSPKEKHVQTIIRATVWGGNMADKSTPSGAVFRQLRKRLLLPDWAVVLKALTVFHRIFQDGSGRFTWFIAQYASNVFQVPNHGEKEAEGLQHKPFIYAYAQYLERWCVTKRNIDWPERPLEPNPQQMQALMGGGGGGGGGGYGYDYNMSQPQPQPQQPPVAPAPSTRTAEGDTIPLKRGPARFVECDILQLLDELPVLQDELDVLLAVRLDVNTTNSAPARAAFRLCLRDMATLLPTVAAATQNLVEQFFSVDILDVLQGAFELYRRFLDQDTGLGQYYEMCRALSMSQQLPDVARPSAEVLDEMFDHIERVNMGEVPRIRGDELDDTDREHEATEVEEEEEEKEEAETEEEEEAEERPSEDERQREAVDASADAGPDDEQMPVGTEGAAVAAVAAAETEREVNGVDAVDADGAAGEGADVPVEEQVEKLSLSGGNDKNGGAAKTAPKEFDLMALLEGSDSDDDDGDGRDAGSLPASATHGSSSTRSADSSTSGAHAREGGESSAGKAQQLSQPLMLGGYGEAAAAGGAAYPPPQYAYGPYGGYGVPPPRGGHYPYYQQGYAPPMPPYYQLPQHGYGGAYRALPPPPPQQQQQQQQQQYPQQYQLAYYGQYPGGAYGGAVDPYASEQRAGGGVPALAPGAAQQGGEYRVKRQQQQRASQTRRVTPADEHFANLYDAARSDK